MESVTDTHDATGDVAPVVEADAGDPGVPAKGDDGAGDGAVTLVPFRVNSRVTDRLEDIHPVVYHDERTTTEEVKAVARLGRLLRMAEGPVVFVPMQMLDTAERALTAARHREIHGVEFSASAIRSGRGDIKKCRQSGFRRADFNIEPADTRSVWGDVLAESGTGKWHLCDDSTSVCAHLNTDNAERVVRRFNMATALVQLDLCNSAEKRLKKYVDRRVARGRAGYCYVD